MCNNFKKYNAIVCLLTVIIIMLTSCGSNQSEEINEKETTITTGDQLIECKYTQRDVAGTFDVGAATKVTLSESYTIKSEGVYIFTGTLKDGQIIVDADDTAKVQIVLNNVSINCSNGPAIYVKGANKVFITLPENTDSALTDGNSYSFSEDEPWGCIFSKSDLTINGQGTLSVTGKYKNGIVSKDDLRITGGTIKVSAKNNGIKGRDSVGIYAGDISINALNDGIKSDNDKDEDKGFVSIDGGTVSITGTASQGIDGASIVQLVKGKLSINSDNEGIQGKILYVSGTKSSITAQDDGLNATDGSTSQGGMDESQSGVYIEIKGGTTIIEASGDGIDSNGDLKVTGGTTIVNGPVNGGDGSLDYNGSGSITGGTFIAIGSNGMAQSFDNNSTQPSFINNSVSGSKDNKISILDETGNEIYKTTAKVDFSSIIYSSKELEINNTYTIKIENTSSKVALTDVVTTIGGTSMNQGRGSMGGPGGF